MVHYDCTVRNSNKQLVQLCYGEDSMDGAKMEFQQLPCIKPSDAEFEQNFRFVYHNPRHLQKYFTKEIVNDLMNSMPVQAELEKEWQQMLKDRKEAREIFCLGNSKVNLIPQIHMMQLTK